MDLKDKCPITKQIDNMDDTIKELNTRIKSLENKLKMLMPDSAERKTLANELNEIKKLVLAHEDRLKDLRKNKRKSFIYIAIVVLLLFFLYCLYVLVYGV